MKILRKNVVFKHINNNLLFNLHVHLYALNKFSVFVWVAHFRIVSTLRKSIAQQFNLIIKIEERWKNECSGGSCNLPKYNTWNRLMNVKWIKYVIVVHIYVEWIPAFLISFKLYRCVEFMHLPVMQRESSLSLKNRYHGCHKWCGRDRNEPESINESHTFLRWFQHATKKFHHAKRNRYFFILTDTVPLLHFITWLKNRRIHIIPKCIYIIYLWINRKHFDRNIENTRCYRKIVAEFLRKKLEKNVKFLFQIYKYGRRTNKLKTYFKWFECF